MGGDFFFGLSGFSFGDNGVSAGFSSTLTGWTSSFCVGDWGGDFFFGELGFSSAFSGCFWLPSPSFCVGEPGSFFVGLLGGDFFFFGDVGGLVLDFFSVTSLVSVLSVIVVSVFVEDSDSSSFLVVRSTIVAAVLVESESRDSVMDVLIALAMTSSVVTGVMPSVICVVPSEVRVSVTVVLCSETRTTSSPDKVPACMVLVTSCVSVTVSSIRPPSPISILIFNILILFLRVDYAKLITHLRSTTKAI